MKLASKLSKSVQLETEISVAILEGEEFANPWQIYNEFKQNGKDIFENKRDFCKVSRLVNRTIINYNYKLTICDKSKPIFVYHLPK